MCFPHSMPSSRMALSFLVFRLPIVGFALVGSLLRSFYSLSFCRPLFRDILFPLLHVASVIHQCTGLSVWRLSAHLSSSGSVRWTSGIVMLRAVGHDAFFR